MKREYVDVEGRRLVISRGCVERAISDYLDRRLVDHSLLLMRVWDRFGDPDATGFAGAIGPRILRAYYLRSPENAKRMRNGRPEDVRQLAAAFDAQQALAALDAVATEAKTAATPGRP